ncbi:MAG: hypothetical protein KME64_24950 [Scytonematopsis contorta HA4267-MV1]|jgi:hypothetical protein|nr:hypothetical protein [Scytonematopsis contorta HA4267-MV1]
MKNVVIASLVTTVVLLILSLIVNISFIMALGECCAGLLGIIVLIDNFIYLREKFHFLNILAATTLISTGLGTFNTYISVSDNWEALISRVGLTSNDSIIIAQLFVVIYCCLLLFLSGYYRSLFSANKHTNFTQRNNIIRKLILKLGNILNKTKTLSAMFFWSLIISIYQLYLLSTGKFGFLSQGLTSQDGTINFDVAIVFAFIPMTYLVMGCVTYNLQQLKAIVNPILVIGSYALISIIQLQWLFIGALRRELIYAVILFLFGLRLSLVNKFLSKKEIWRLTVVGVIILFLMSAGIYLTSLLRFLMNNIESLKNQSFIDILNFTIKSFLSFNSQDNINISQKFEEGLNDNLSTRTFVLSALALILEKMGAPPKALLGDEFLFNFLRSLPGFLYPEKYGIQTSETLYSQHFGIPDVDIADSFYLSAYIDFYWLGVIFYPLFFYLILNLFVKIIMQLKNNIFITVQATATLIQLCLLGGESPLISFFVGLRDLFTTMMLISIIKFLFRNNKFNQKI